MKLPDKLLYELWYIFCAGGGPYYDISARDKMSREIQENCTPEEFIAMLELLVNAPESFSYNGKQILLKERSHELRYGLSQEFLGYLYVTGFSNNQIVNNAIVRMLEAFPANNYVLDFAGCTGNLGLIYHLRKIRTEENQEKIAHVMRAIIELYYDNKGLTDERAVEQMLEENRLSDIYTFLIQSVQADREAVRQGILNSK